MTEVDRFKSRIKKKDAIVLLVIITGINKPQPNLHSGDTSIQGQLLWSQGCPLNGGSL